jgi:hypothetical protein
VNIPGGIQADELPQTRAEKPRYPEFVLQMHQNVNGIENETARITVYDSTLAVNVQAQDHSTDALFANTPVKQTGTLVGHKTVQYFYQGDTRIALYLIDDGQRTYEIRGLVDSTDPPSWHSIGVRLTACSNHSRWIALSNPLATHPKPNGTAN